MLSMQLIFVALKFLTIRSWTTSHKYSTVPNYNTQSNLNHPCSRTQTLEKSYLHKATMFNVNITASGAFPSTIQVSAALFSSAVSFYQSRLRAKVTKQSSKSVVMKSAYGFLFRVDRTSATRTQSSVRLALHSSINKAKIAKSLGAGARVGQFRSGLEVTDPYHVKWTVV